MHVNSKPDTEHDESEAPAVRITLENRMVAVQEQRIPHSSASAVMTRRNSQLGKIYAIVFAVCLLLLVSSQGDPVQAQGKANRRI
ncbi:hypothetical protein BDR05DRAFT_742064 [Suillus weaverae]|nr:hypothetical protein BDR05DRAFT_742064 [Suillus weaverae]